MSIPVTLISAGTDTTAGAEATLDDFSWNYNKDLLPKNWTVQITTTAASSAVVGNLEGSIDGGTNWNILGTHTMTSGELTAKAAVFHVADKPVTSVRFNPTTFTRSGAETMTVTCVASR
jgi:hypothetical protein